MYQTAEDVLACTPNHQNVIDTKIDLRTCVDLVWGTNSSAEETQNETLVYLNVCVWTQPLVRIGSRRGQNNVAFYLGLIYKNQISRGQMCYDC